MREQIMLEQLADDLLLRIRQSPDTAWQVSDLAAYFNVEAQHIDTALNILQMWGYRLKRTRNTVYFKAPPDLITSTEVRYRLQTKLMGKEVHSYQSAKSTNDLAASLAQSGVKEGTIVTAEEQTKGRGRFTRTWHSPQHTGVYVSIILRPPFTPDQAPGLSIMTAVALADTIEEHCPGDVKIKWPNDVLLRGKKTAGILTELSADTDRVNHVIVGVGINVNQTADDFPIELQPIATSIRRVTRRKIDRVALLRSFLVNIEKRYLQYRKNRLRLMHKRIRELSSLLGQDIRLKSGRNVTVGTVEDIDENGALILRSDGERIEITSGEVSVIKDHS